MPLKICAPVSARRECWSLIESHRSIHFPTIELSDPALERYGLRCVTVRSPALNQRADVTLWIPDAPRIDTLLILLHGVYGSHWVWSLKAGVHRTAQALLERGEIEPMVIAMPSDGLSYDGSGYLAWPGGPDVERWIVEEVPAIARLAVPQMSPTPRLAIGGLSMGGYGALRLGAKFPHLFRAISAHSAITRIPDLSPFVREPLAQYLACSSAQDLDPLYWMQQHRPQLPALRFDCGVSDSLLTGNRALHDALQLQGIAHAYEELPGAHDWPYWATNVERTLRHADLHCRQGS